MRLIEPNQGSVVVEGKCVLSLDRRSMREMRKSGQMIFQDPYASLSQRMTVDATIAEPFLGTARQAKDVVADLLTKVGLSPETVTRYPHEFSGGQRQRICIVHALALEPKVIVADESVSALDVSIKAQVINLMLLSHDMAVVERVSDRVAVMYLGEIVEIGPRSAIFENPQHPYTKRLIAAVPVPDPDRRAEKRKTVDEEIKSPIRPLDYQPPIIG